MGAAEPVKSSWADEVEDESNRGPLPPSTEVLKNGVKTVVEYKYNDEGKKIKIVRTYKIEKRTVSQSIAVRKTWPKFGDAKDDKPGPNPATTIVSNEEVYMAFITSVREDEKIKVEEEAQKKMEKLVAGSGAVKCRTCNGDHWTSKCPYKGSEAFSMINKDAKPAAPPGAISKDAAPQSKYIPPSLREGANQRGESMNLRRDDTLAIRISNLSESVIESDLEELVKSFGPISKIYLARDKITGNCKGFAYVHFRYRQDASAAIVGLNGHGYDHLILNVEWSKSQPLNN